METSKPLMALSDKMCYNNRGRGADIAFDVWTLTDYFASRPLALPVFLIVNPIKSAIAAVKDAFSVRSFAFAPALAV